MLLRTFREIMCPGILESSEGIVQPPKPSTLFHLLGGGWSRRASEKFPFESLQNTERRDLPEEGRLARCV